MTYSVKEIFYTLQGEGIHTGRPAIFCRFSGCNLWNGKEKDRNIAICRFCDTNFYGTDGVGGGKFKTSEALAKIIELLWPSIYPFNKYVVFTGGEPLLQLDIALINSLHALHFEVAIETNGTIPVPPGIDWICVSPKIQATLKVLKGNELKVVIPQENQILRDYEPLDFQHFLVQPMDGPNFVYNTKLAINFVKSNPYWKLSIQTHKLLKIS